MKISGVHFKDKHCWHLKITDYYSSQGGSLLKINNDTIQLKEQSPSHYSTNLEYDYIVPSDDLTVFRLEKCRVISSYINAESGEVLPLSRYEELLQSFKKEDGFKDLESEYAYKKMKQVYKPVYKEYYEEKQVPVIKEEYAYSVDKYTYCSGQTDSNGFFLFKFNIWEYANDTVISIMNELNVERTDNRKTKANQYILHRLGEYQWLEFCGDEYFITNKDMFGFGDKQGFIYGTCENVEKEKASIKENLKAKIEKKLDYYNSVSVRKSLIDKISNKVDNLMTMITNHKGNRSTIYNELSLVKQFISVMLNDKQRVK